MAEQKLNVIVNAIDLMEYTIKITSNRKRYPVKYIQLVKRIQNKSMDIYEFLLEANRLSIATSKIDRLELQTRAITSCDTKHIVKNNKIKVQFYSRMNTVYSALPILSIQNIV